VRVVVTDTQHGVVVGDGATLTITEQPSVSVSIASSGAVSVTESSSGIVTVDGDAANLVTVSGQGAAGIDGRSVRNGSGAPGAGVGNNGDFYIDTDTHDWYGPKTAGVWGSRYSRRMTVSATEPTGAVNGDVWIQPLD
jgi:hypothetical protein